jgi:leucyl-tRNA synthetase
VLVNGKVRDRITVSADITEEEAKAYGLASPGVKKFITGVPIKKVFYVAGRGMVNIVV